MFGSGVEPIITIELRVRRVIFSSYFETFPMVEGIGILLGEFPAPPVSALFLWDAPEGSL